MTSILKIGERWWAQIRRKGAKPITKTFRTKAEAAAWALDIDARIDAGLAVWGAGIVTVGQYHG